MRRCVHRRFGHVDLLRSLAPLHAPSLTKAIQRPGIFPENRGLLLQKLNKPLLYKQHVNCVSWGFKVPTRSCLREGSQNRESLNFGRPGQT